MKYAIGFCILSAVLLLTGCQSFDDTVKDVRQRLSVLENKGLPDSVITPIRLSIVSAQGEKQRNRGSEANKNLKKAVAAVKHAEEFLENSLKNKKPEVIGKYNALVGKVNNELRGLHKSDADSLLTEIDGFLKMDFVFKAERLIQQLEKDYPKKLNAQKTADSLRKKVQGTWTFTETTKNTEDPTVNSVEKKVFTFNKDGSSKFIEEKKGKSSPNLKEDWKFETWGTWDMRGDTVCVIATKFTQHKQIFWQYNELTQKWGHVNSDNKFVENKPNEIPAETLTIEANKDDVKKQNRYVVYQDLADEYKKQ